MTFEPVETKNVSDGPKELCIHKGGSGYLTAAAVREWFLHTDTIRLYVDRDHSQLGIRRNGGKGDTYSLTKKENDSGATIHPKAALRELDIDVDEIEETWRFELTFREDGSLIVADLTELVEAHTGAVHCDECGQRFANENSMKSHYTKKHDEEYGAKILEEANPDDIGEPIPPSPAEESGSDD